MKTAGTPGFSLSWPDKSMNQNRWTGPWAYPQEPNWILPHWGPYRWPYCIFQWQERYSMSSSLRPLPWCLRPRCPYSWSSPNPWINLTLQKSSEQMQCSLPDPKVTIPLLRSYQECVVSSFMSVIDASRHDEASLFIEWSDVVQHMHVHLLSHSDCSVSSTMILSFSSVGLDKVSIW